MATTGGDGDEVGIDTAGLKYGWGVKAPGAMPGGTFRGVSRGADISEGLQLLTNLLPNRKVRYETVEVSSSKASKGGKELRELVMKAISEAFGQPLPAEAELAAATKEFREQQREQSAADASVARRRRSSRRKRKRRRRSRSPRKSRRRSARSPTSRRF
jgi:RNase P/RNase MRP subunit POP5